MSKRRYNEDRDCLEKEGSKSSIDHDSGVPAKAIRMSDPENELDMIEFPKERLSESSENPFDSLPDELVLKVMKMYANGRSLYTDPGAHYSVAMNSIARVSSRFRRIAADRSLWSGHVKLHFQEPDHLWHYVVLYTDDYSGIRFQDIIDCAIKFLLHDQIEVIHLVDKEHSNTELTQDQLRTIAKLCPRFESLVLCFVRVESVLGWKVKEEANCRYCRMQGRDDDHKPILLSIH